MNTEGWDPEVIELALAMNRFPGIRTFESCCGHGAEPFRIWFAPRRLRDLPPLLYWFDGCHTGHYGWRVIARTDCAMSPAIFMAEGPVGQQAYDEALHIAELMNEYTGKE